MGELAGVPRGARAAASSASPRRRSTPLGRRAERGGRGRGRASPALKTIAAYRSGLDVDRPTASQAARSAALAALLGRARDAHEANAATRCRCRCTAASATPTSPAARRPGAAEAARRALPRRRRSCSCTATRSCARPGWLAHVYANVWLRPLADHPARRRARPRRCARRSSWRRSRSSSTPPTRRARRSSTTSPRAAGARRSPRCSPRRCRRPRPRRPAARSCARTRSSSTGWPERWPGGARRS